MTAIIKNKFRLQNARDFLENFNSSAHDAERNHYLFIGKPTPWGTGSQLEELSPPAPADAYFSEARIWEDMIALKKIDSASTSLVIRRSDWDESLNTVYAIYDDQDSQLHNQPTQTRISQFSPATAGTFYVMNDLHDIFVCLENGNNSISTEKPVKPNNSTDLVDYRGIDGYVWKYVATVSSPDSTRFLTDNWVPVETLTASNGTTQYDAQIAAISGEVLSVVVESGGSNYTKTYTGTVTTLSNSGGKGYAILSTGSPSGEDDYYNNGQIHITSGDGITEIYTIEDYVGGTKQVILTEEWSGNVSSGDSCQILPRLTVTTNGSEIRLRPVVDESGAITKIIPLSRGTGSTYANVVVEDSLGGTGASLRVILSDLDGLGSDPEKDLNAIYIMLNVKLQYDELGGDFLKNNDYRQLGIIRDVRSFGGSLATDSTLIATKKLSLTNVSNSSSLLPDEIFQVDSTTKGIALEYNKTSGEGVLPETGTLTFIQTPVSGYATFSDGDIISGTQSSFSAELTTPNSVIAEEIQRGAGHIIYIENRRAVVRSQDQIEDIKAIIEF